MFPLWCPLFTESPFAPSGCYPSRDGVSRHLGKRYPSFLAPMGSCADPYSSCWLWFSLGQQVFAVCCQSLLGEGPSRRYLCESFPACLDPYPGCSCGAFARFFPQDFGLPYVVTRSALSIYSVQRLSARAHISRLQSFVYLQARGFACHPGRPYRSFFFCL